MLQRTLAWDFAIWTDRRPHDGVHRAAHPRRPARTRCPTRPRQSFSRPLGRARFDVSGIGHPTVPFSNTPAESALTLSPLSLRRTRDQVGMERRSERHARLPPLARGQHPKRRILGQPVGVVGVLVPRQAAVDGLAKEIRQGELGVASGDKACIMRLLTDAMHDLSPAAILSPPVARVAYAGR